MTNQQPNNKVPLVRWVPLLLLIAQAIGMSFDMVAPSGRARQVFDPANGWSIIGFVWVFVVLALATTLALLTPIARRLTGLNTSVLIRALLVIAAVGDVVTFVDVTLLVGPSPELSVSVGAIALCVVGALALVLAVVDAIAVREPRPVAAALGIALVFGCAALAMTTGRTLSLVANGTSVKVVAGLDRLGGVPAEAEQVMPLSYYATQRIGTPAIGETLVRFSVAMLAVCAVACLVAVFAQRAGRVSMIFASIAALAAAAVALIWFVRFLGDNDTVAHAVAESLGTSRRPLEFVARASVGAYGVLAGMIVSLVVAGMLLRAGIAGRRSGR